MRTRAGVVAVVIVGHVVVLALLTAGRARDADPGADPRMTLVFVDPVADDPPLLAAGRPQRMPRAARSTALKPPATTVVAALPDPTSAIDWYANGSAAARRAVTEPTTRDFGLPKRKPAPRGKKPFGWDVVHTERVHALEGGGIGIHLSDNCELTLAPLPMAGCAFGKRKARGDLFDEMKAPPALGDSPL